MIFSRILTGRSGGFDREGCLVPGCGRGWESVKLGFKAY